MSNARKLKIQDGSYAVLLIRLATLEAAIRQRDWDRVEWHYDRVLRSAQKLGRR